MNISKVYTRFWSKVDVGYEDECWNWNSGLSSGYGSFTCEGKEHLAHRFAWFLTYGAYPELYVCHTCDNPLCCNPNHLFLGTHRDNMNDMISKGRNAKGERHGSAKLTEKDILEIYKLYFEDNLTEKQISTIMNVCKQHISKIINGKFWKYLYERYFSRQD